MTLVPMGYNNFFELTNLDKTCVKPNCITFFCGARMCILDFIIIRARPN